TTSASTAVDSRFWEFLKHAYQTNHVWSSNVMAVNLAAWNRLSAEHRAAIEKVARELEPTFWNASLADDTTSVATLKARGVSVAPVASAVDTALRGIAKGQGDAYVQRVGGPAPELVQRFRTQM